MSAIELKMLKVSELQVRRGQTSAKPLKRGIKRKIIHPMTRIISAPTLYFD